MSQSNDFNEHSNAPQESQGNPFSADLKGDFTSNFGTSTNAVSQIFKDGAFGGENKTKAIVIGIVVLVVIVCGFLIITSGDDYEDDDLLLADEELLQDESSGKKAGTSDKNAKDNLAAKESLAMEDDIVDDKPKLESEAAEDLAAGGESLPSPIDANATDASAVYNQFTDSSNSYMPAATEAPALSSPEDGVVRYYDETTTEAEFSWGSPGGWIVFSRNSSMKPVSFRSRVSGNSYVFRKPYPGLWYWQVKNGAGASGVRSFRVEAPPRRALALAAPTEGSTLAGSGGTVQWTGDHKVAFYRVELSTGSWANPMYRFATSATQLQIQNVPAGQYQLRLGAFSEVAGRWEYTQPVNVTVQ